MLLSAAYGILEEGLAAKTISDPHQPFMGNLTVYGHYFGINWVPFAAFLLFHSVFSITLMIFLLERVFPQTK